MNELQQFLDRWDAVAQGTVELMRSLADDAYDYRPDPGARSIGELAWHLAEVEAYSSYGIERGKVGDRPPNIDRPKTIADLAPRYEAVHREARERISRLDPSDLDTEIRYFDGRMLRIREVLWDRILIHAVHHRGQLSVLCRLSGGIAPGLAGPNREESATVRARLEAEAVAGAR